MYFHIKHSNLHAGVKACVFYSLLVQSVKFKGIILTEDNFLFPLPFREDVMLQASVMNSKTGICNRCGMEAKVVVNCMEWSWERRLGQQTRAISKLVK